MRTGRGSYRGGRCGAATHRPGIIGENLYQVLYRYIKYYTTNKTPANN